MSRSRKKSFSQKVVGAGAVGMPTPVRKFLSGRVISALIVLITPVLFATGVLSLNWENGMPSLSVNREKAEEVGEAVTEVASEKVHELRDDRSHTHLGGATPAPVLTSLEGAFSGFGPENPAPTSNELSPAERFTGLSSNLFHESNGESQLLPPATPEEPKSLFGNSPLSSLKQQFENRR